VKSIAFRDDLPGVERYPGGQTLLTASDKDGSGSRFERELPEAAVDFSQQTL
jgi:hypothetical protein